MKGHPMPQCGMPRVRNGKESSRAVLTCRLQTVGRTERRQLALPLMPAPAVTGDSVLELGSSGTQTQSCGGAAHASPGAVPLGSQAQVLGGAVGVSYVGC